MGIIGIITELIVLICVAAGIACNSAVLGSCQMLKLGGDGGYIGPWRADIEGSGCLLWDKDDMDLMDWRVQMARVSGIVAIVFGFLFAASVVFREWLIPHHYTQLLMDLNGLGVQISLCLFWPVFASDICTAFGGCTWGKGATALLCSQLFYLTASILTRGMGMPACTVDVYEDEEKADQMTAGDNSA